MPSLSSMPVFSTEGVVDSCRVSIFCSLRNRAALSPRVVYARESQRLVEGRNAGQARFLLGASSF